MPYFSKKILLSSIIILGVISLGAALVYKEKFVSSVQKNEDRVSTNLNSKIDNLEPSESQENQEDISIESLNDYELFAHDIKRANNENTSTISVQFFGDMMLERNVAKAMGTKGLDYLFEKIAGEKNGLSHHADLLVANLEGPFAPTRVPTTKSIAFRFDPKLAGQLKKYQFDGFSLANNHTLDMGKQNVDFTRNTLREQGLAYFGYQTKEDKELVWIAEIPEKTDKVAFVGFNNTDHPLNMTKVTETINDAKEKARYVIVFMHWGPEYKQISRTQERDLAHLLVDKGVDAVIGAHPHVVQEMELYKGKPIFYSLGNFIFDQYFSKETQEGISVGLIFQEGQVKSAYVFPFYGVKSQVQLMEGEREQKFFEWFNKNSRIGDKKFEKGKIEL